MDEKGVLFSTAFVKLYFENKTKMWREAKCVLEDDYMHILYYISFVHYYAWNYTYVLRLLFYFQKWFTAQENDLDRL